ncbi:MAG: flagellin [Pseudomonadota bacterium]
MRVSDLGMQAILLQSFQNAQNAAQTRQIQLGSGDRFQTYGGYGADALRLVSAEGVISRASAFENASSIALSRLETQGASLEQISDSVESIRAGFIRTLSNGNAELLPPEIETAAQRIIAALNINIGGVYLFGGTAGDRPPVTAGSLGDIGAAPSIPALFDEGGRASLTVEEGGTIDGGPLASEVAADLFVELQSFANIEATLGPLDGELTAAQRDFLVAASARLGEIADDLYQIQGLSAVSQGQAADAADRNRRAREAAEITAAEIEDVDIAEALSALSQDQIAIEASARALAEATQLSLLNFI